MQELELVKIICVTVVAVREDGKVLTEIEGNPKPCYSAEQLQEYYAEAEREVAQQNVLQQANGDGGENGNRAQRRSRRKAPAG